MANEVVDKLGNYGAYSKDHVYNIKSMQAAFKKKVQSMLDLMVN